MDRLTCAGQLVRHDLLCDLLGNLTVFGLERDEPTLSLLVGERREPDTSLILKEFHW
ncbi:MAG: hypothetical protein WB696_07130 [Chthoniobacterales bacterium]